MRNLKIIAVAGLVGFLITGAFMVWVGISAANYVSAKVKQSAQFAATQTWIDNLRVGSLGLQNFNCWNRVQRLMEARPWFENSILDNVLSLKLACLEKKTELCQGHACSEMKEILFSTEGRTI